MATAGARNRQSTQRLVFKQGYLKKIPNSNKFGSSLKRAERRWFVFGGLSGVPFLEYYDSEEGQFRNPPINTISLLTCRYVNHSQDFRYNYVLHIGLIDRVLSLAAPTVEDMQAWERELQRKLEKLGILHTGNADHHTYTEDPTKNSRMNIYRQNSRDPNSPLPVPPDAPNVPLLNSAASMSVTPSPNLSSPSPKDPEDPNTSPAENGISSAGPEEYEAMWQGQSRNSPRSAPANSNTYSEFPRSDSTNPTAINGSDIPAITPPPIPERQRSRHLSFVAGHGRTAEGQSSIDMEETQHSQVTLRRSVSLDQTEEPVVLRRPQQRNVPVNRQTTPPVLSQQYLDTTVNTPVSSDTPDQPFLVSPKMLEVLSMNSNEESPIFGWGAPPPDEGAPPPYTPSQPSQRASLPPSVKALKESQVEQLRKEITHSGGVRIVLTRADCHHAIALVDCFGAVWIAGWNQTARPFLYTALHIGDQVISVNSQVVENTTIALKLIKRCRSQDQITFLIRRMPYAKVFAVKRSAEGQSLGIRRDGGTAEIVYVEPNGLAASGGLTVKSPTLDGSSFCNWVLTEINNRPLNLFFKENEIEHRLNAVGLDITFLVQPKDFIAVLKKQLKSIKNYKDFLVQ